MWSCKVVNAITCSFTFLKASQADLTFIEDVNGSVGGALV